MRRRSVRSLVLLVLAAPGLAALAPTRRLCLRRAPSARTRRAFNIAAQPVSQALREYAQQSGDQVVFYSDIGKGRESPPVRAGSHARKLCSALANTGLKYRRVNAKTIAISTARGGGHSRIQRTSMPHRCVWRKRRKRAPHRCSTRKRASRGEQGEQSLFGVEEVIVTGTAVASAPSSIRASRSRRSAPKTSRSRRPPAPPI